MDPMADPKKIRVAVNGYGVIGKRVAAAVALQEDMSLVGVSDVVTDWRAHMVTRNGFSLFGATAKHAGAMRTAGLGVTGTLDELLGQADVVVDCTPKRIAAKNIDVYRRRGLKFILQAARNTARPAIPLWLSRTMPARLIARQRVSCRAIRLQSSAR